MGALVSKPRRAKIEEGIHKIGEGVDTGWSLPLLRHRKGIDFNFWRVKVVRSIETAWRTLTLRKKRPPQNIGRIEQ